MINVIGYAGLWWVVLCCAVSAGLLFWAAALNFLSATADPLSERIAILVMLGLLSGSLLAVATLSGLEALQLI